MNRQEPLDFSEIALRGTLWTYAARFGGKPLSLIGTLVLVRLLAQEDFGVAAYAVALIGFLTPLSDIGIGAALIYYRDDPEVADTAFWLGLAVGTALFALAWWFAPLAGEFFHDSRAVPATRALALTFPLAALSGVHQSIVQKRLSFQRQFPPALSKVVVKYLVAILLAAWGAGPWSLIWGQVAGTAAWTLAYWWAFRWHPLLRFALPSARAILSYGKHILLINLLAALMLNADAFLVGHLLGPSLLGAYTVGFHVPDLLVIQLCHVLHAVLFPLYVRLSADVPALRAAFLQTVRHVSLITVPLGLGLALVAEPFVLTFFTARWADAIPVMQALSIYALMLSLERQVSSLFKARGRLSLLVGMTLLRAALYGPALWWAATGPAAIAAVSWVRAAVATLFTLVYLALAAQMLDIAIPALAAALRPALIAGLLMALGTGIVLGWSAALPPALQLAAAALVGASLYIAAGCWLQRDELLHLRQALSRLTRARASKRHSG